MKNMFELKRVSTMSVNRILLITLLSTLQAVPNETSVQRSDLIDNPQRKSAFTYQVHSA